MAGLVQVGQSYKSQAKGGLERVAQLEHQRETTEENLKTAEKGQKKQLMGMGAGMGAMLAAGTGFGSSMAPAMLAGGPMGAAAGLAIGYLASEVF